MSDTVLHTGKLVKRELNGLTVEEYYQKKCEEKGITIKNDGITWEETYCWDYGYPVTLDGVVYDTVNDVESDPNYYVKLTEQPDGTYDYVAIFYNGGTYLGECLESEYQNMKKNS